MGVKEHQTSTLDKAFYTSLTLKGIDSLLEVVGGILLLVISPATINRIAVLLTQNELSEDPHDFVAGHLQRFSHDLTASATLFGALYLLSHGIVKITLIIALFKRKLWAYPWMMGVLGVFIIYQLYRLSYRFSAGLVALTLFDAFIIWLTWLEYKKHKAQATIA